MTTKRNLMMSVAFGMLMCALSIPTLAATTKVINLLITSRIIQTMVS